MTGDLYQPPRPGWLKCWHCREDKPDTEFQLHVAFPPFRRYRHFNCKACVQALVKEKNR